MQPQRLAGPHARLGQQQEQEAVPQVLAGRQDRHDLRGSKVHGACRGTGSFTGRTGMARPLVT